MINYFPAPLTRAQSTYSSRARCHHWSLLIIGLAFLFGPSVTAIEGQATNPFENIGLPPFSTTLPVENGYVNAATGDLHLEIPLGAFPQRGGHTFKAALVYDSSIWGVSPGGGIWHGNVSGGFGGFAGGGGWRLVTSADAPASYSSPSWIETDSGYCSEDGGPTNALLNSFTYAEQDGTVHPFNLRQGYQLPTACNNYTQYTPAPESGWAVDASGFYMTVGSDQSATVWDPDGNQITPNFGDTNGNSYTTTVTGPCGLDFTDNLGRDVLKVSSNTGVTICYYDVLNSQGTTNSHGTAGTSTYTVALETINVHTNFFGNSNDWSGTITVVQSVTLPDGTSYSFNYDSGTTAGNYGLVTSMTLPTGGEIQYSFANLFDAFNNLNRAIRYRTTPDSTTAWGYSFQADHNTSDTCHTTSPYACIQTLTVTAPSGDNRVYSFQQDNGFWPIEVDYYNQSVSSANLLATRTQTFDFSQNCGSDAPCFGYEAMNVTKLSSTTTLPVPGSSVSATAKYTWDSNKLGLLTLTKEWNFGSNTSSNPDRTTTITYLGGPGTSYANEGSTSPTTNILNRQASVTVADSSGNTVAKTLNAYDGSSFASGATGIAQHDDTNYSSSNTVRGNLTQVQKLISGTSNYLTKSMTYDITGQLHTETDWTNSNTTTYSYADNFFTDSGNTSNPPSTYTSSTSTNAYVKTVTLPNSLATTYGYYWGTGQKGLSTDPNSQTTYFHFYDSMNRPTSAIFPNSYNSSCCGWKYLVYPSGSETQVDTGTGITSTTLSISCTASTGDCRHDQTLLDTSDRLSSQILVSDPDGPTTVGTTYDSNGRVYTVTNPHRSSSLPTDGTETYPTYDGLNRRIQDTRPDGSVTYTYYGAAVSSHGGVGSQLCSGFGIGYPVLHIDEASRVLQDWYDGFGRLIEVDEPDPSSGSLTSGSYAGTCYSYDLNNNLTGVTQGSQTRTYSYDMLSRLTQSVDPESGTTNFYYTTSGGSLCSGDPSAVCRRVAPLENQTGSSTVTTTYTYDSLNRLTGKSYSDSTPSVSFSYDATSCLDLATACYNKNRRTGMSDGSGSTSWAYDQVGNVREEKRTIGTVTNNIQYTYNLDSSVATIQYPSGRTITYQPGDAQRPLSAKDVTDSINYVVGVSSPYYVTYAPQGAPQLLENGSSLVSQFYYNNRLQPCRISVKNTGTSPTSCADSTDIGNVLDLTYGLNAGSSDNGNVASAANNRDTTRSQTYTYDYLNRVATAAASTYATSPANCWGEAYTLDRYGNLSAIASLSSSYTGCTNTENLSITVSTSTNRVTTSGYCYDAAGNMDGVSSCSAYTYDAENRLISAGGVTYTYDGNDKRVEKSSGTLYWYDTGLNPLAETDSSGTTTNEYIFFNGKRIARRDSSGNVDYYFADDLHSSRVVTNSSGTILDDDDFYPYGGERSVSSSSGNHYLFTGKEHDSESGLDYFMARQYASFLGRFMQVDDFKGGIVDAYTGLDIEAPGPLPYADINDPQTLNKYAYVRNNPLRYIDPNGHGKCDMDANDCAEQNAEKAQKQNTQQTQEQKQYQQDLKQHDQQVNEKQNPSAPAVGSPEYIKQVSGQVSSETTAGEKYILAPVAGVEGAVVAAVAAPEAAAAYGTVNATLAAHPNEVVQFGEGVIAGASPGASAPPPTLSGVAGYAVGKAVSWVADKIWDNKF